MLSTAGLLSTLQGTAIQSVSASQIRVSVNVGATARAWSLQVVNPNGTVSGVAALTVK
jgi:hypothetical protein